jgi:hypothetical protein
MKPCPTDEQRVRFVDGSLAPEEADRVGKHVASCPQCRDRDEMLRALIADVKAAVPAAVDVQAHARAVMDRLDRPVAARSKPPGARWLVGAAAVGVLVVLGYRGLRAPSPTDAWQARGGHAHSAIGRDVGVQPYALEVGLHPLVSGSTIDGTTPLTAGFRNVGDAPAFLLLFAVDSRRIVHWISPSYTRPGEDPASTILTVSVGERILESTAVFDDVGAGALRVVAVITPAPAHVSDVESLAGTDLSAIRLTRRIPGAEVRETIVDVRDADGGAR